MKISLLIATINRKEELRTLLKSIATQTYCNFQILIADQNKEGFLAATLAEFSEVLPITVLPVLSKGVSQARNALLPYADGDIIAFPDDDCFYAPNTLQKVVEAFTQFSNISSIIGEWVSPENSEKIKDSPIQSPKVVGRFLAFKRGGTHVQFYRREVIEIVGEFDPMLGPGTGLPYGCGEDTDYILRTLEANFIVARVSEVKVFHENIDLSAPHIKDKLRAYALGRMFLLKKHNFSYFIQIIHVLYPLIVLPLGIINKNKNYICYRWIMFCQRLNGFLSNFR